MVENIPHQEYIKKINRCLDFLRKTYPKHKLVYKPHPRETNEAEKINLTSFRRLGKQDNFEIYLINNLDKIDSVFAVKSMAIRSSFNFHINSYLFLHLFSFENSVKKYFDQVFTGLPKHIFIEDLNKKPKQIFKY